MDHKAQALFHHILLLGVSKLNKQSILRISCASLNRISFDGQTLLVALNKNRMKKGIKQYSPIGGALEFNIADVRITDDLNASLEKSFSSDLRIQINESSLPQFETWFKSRQSRETDSFRELYEELVEELDLLSELNTKDVTLNYIGLFSTLKKSTRQGAKGALTKYYFEVFEAVFSSGHIEEMNHNLNDLERNPDYRSRFVTPEEISNGKTIDGITIAENCLPLIGKSITFVI